MSNLKLNLQTILDEKENKIIPENIKKGVSIFNIQGTLEIGTDTTDATAKETDILEGTTAYIANGKVTGTMINNGDITIIPEENEKVTKLAGYYSNIEVEAVDKTDFYKNCKQLITDILNNESLVPDTFEQLEYIEGTGEQYIKLSDWYDTKLSTSNFYDIVADVQFTVLPSEYDDKWHLNGVGSTSGTSLNKYDTLLYFGYSYYDPSLSDPIPKFCYSPSLKNTDCVTDRYIDTERHIFKVISNANKPEAGFWIDDEHVDTRGSTLSTKKFGYPFCICGYENKSGVIGNKQRVHRYQILNDDGSLFYDLIPTRRKLDNAIGLYDIIREVFYPNNGTGEFLYGEIRTTLEEDLQEILDKKGEAGWDYSLMTGCNSMFKGNKELTDAPFFDTQNVVTMNKMFSDCSKLVNVPKYNTSKVTDTAEMFYNCSSLVEAPELNTSSVENMGSMFSGCNNLKTVPKYECGEVSYIYGNFNSCNLLENVGGLVDLGKGYTSQNNNSTGCKLKLDKCNNLTHDSLMNIINNLYDLNLTYDVANGGTLYSQNLILGSTNMAKLTADEIAIATNKGWNVT